MRILLIADIHSNWPALQAIEDSYDLCICLGDIVDYGMDPGPCIEWVRRNSLYAVRGNHDHGTAQDVTVIGQKGFKYLTGVTRPLNRERIDPEGLRFLASLPLTKVVTLDETRFMLVHATPRDPLDEYAPADVDFWARRLEDVDADVVCVGHTHQPYILEVGEKVVVNPGSVGLPRDGDPRGAYAIMENRRVELKRMAYPVESSIQSIKDSALPDQAKELLTNVLRTGGGKAQT